MNKPSISKEKLQNLYWEQKLSTYKIAKLYRCHPAQIRKQLQINKIKIRSRQEAIILDRGINISKSRLRSLYWQQDLSIYQIAPLFSCHPATIAKKLQGYNIPIKPPKQKVKITKKELEKLYLKKKLSTYNIAKILRCNVRTVRKKMKKYGVSARPLKKVVIGKNKLEKLYLKEKLSLKEIGKIYNLTPVAVFRKMRKHNIPLRESWAHQLLSPKKPFTGSLKEKAYLIGFRLGDLRVAQSDSQTRSIKTGCNSTKIEQARLIKRLFSKYSHVSVSKPNKIGVINIDTLLHPSFSFLLPKVDYVKSWIRANLKYMAAFIAGYTDAEGSIGVYNGRARFRLGSYDIGILRQITATLREYGVKSSLNLEQVKGFKDKRGVIHRGNFWRINVNEMHSLLLLFRLIDPHLKHEKRKKDLLKAKRNVTKRLKGKSDTI